MYMVCCINMNNMKITSFDGISNWIHNVWLFSTSGKELLFWKNIDLIYNEGHIELFFLLNKVASLNK